MSRSWPIKRILLIGGGHAHLQVLAKWKGRSDAGIELTLISAEADTPYSGMVPGHLLGFYAREDIHINLERAAVKAGARFIHARAQRLDVKTKTVILEGGQSLPFDIASLNIGGRGEPATDDPRVIQVRPLSVLIEQWPRMVERLMSWSSAAAPRVFVVGGGASGFELALALASLTAKALTKPRITLWQREETLAGHTAKVRRIASQALLSRGIHVRTGVEAKSWSGGVLEFGSGREEFDYIVLATPARSDPMFKDSGLPVDDKGFLLVTESLQVPGSEFLFGAGDGAHFPKPIPRSGVFAVRQGQHLAESLWRVTHGQEPRPYQPQRRSLALISLGERRALASYGGFGASSEFLWRLKNGIDRRFMDQFKA